MIYLRSLLGSAALLIAIGTTGLASPSTAGTFQLVPQPAAESLLVEAQSKSARCFNRCVANCRNAGAKGAFGCDATCNQRCGY